jgi:hypothetical protein
MSTVLWLPQPMMPSVMRLLGAFWPNAEPGKT